MVLTSRLIISTTLEKVCFGVIFCYHWSLTELFWCLSGLDDLSSDSTLKEDADRSEPVLPDGGDLQIEEAVRSMDEEVPPSIDVPDSASVDAPQDMTGEASFIVRPELIDSSTAPRDEHLAVADEHEPSVSTEASIPDPAPQQQQQQQQQQQRKKLTQQEVAAIEQRAVAMTMTEIRNGT
jgi:hypothetical protein